MAEYKMSYDELQHFVENAINISHGNKEKLLSHKAEILTALTGVFSDEILANQREQEQLMQLWSNQQDEKSQILLGRRHIRIHDGMLAFLEAFITGGACDVILDMAMGVSLPAALTVGAFSSVVVALVKVFREAASLEDFDFCLYMQAITHFHEKREFSKKDIISWYPDGETCNMHIDKWDCCHTNSDDTCGVDSGIIDEIIASLVEKGILKTRFEGKEKLYKIRG